MAGFAIGQHGFEAPALDAGLYVVATPIGNLGDISLRALETLSAASVIACEDTRVTARLLSRYAIMTPTRPYHEHNAAREGPVLLDRVAAGEAVALVSDAGTPLVSDPGQRLVADARSRNLAVYAIPGASAPLAALAASGLPGTRFTFAGFLPPRQAARRTALEAFRPDHGTLIFFEGPSRLAAALADMADVFGPEHPACIARELTKLHEEYVHATLGELAGRYQGDKPRGEIVVLVAPLPEVAYGDPRAVLSGLLRTMSVSRAAAEAARMTGLPKRELYALALELSEQSR